MINRSRSFRLLCVSLSLPESSLWAACQGREENTSSEATGNGPWESLHSCAASASDQQVAAQVDSWAPGVSPAQSWLLGSEATGADLSHSFSVSHRLSMGRGDTFS